MTPNIVLTFAYGAIALVGGLIGYQQAKSKMSLISGTISGILLIVAGLLLLKGLQAGLLMSQILSVTLVAVFVMRLIKTKKLMPAALMMVAGIVTFASSFI